MKNKNRNSKGKGREQKGIQQKRNITKRKARENKGTEGKGWQQGKKILILIRQVSYQKTFVETRSMNECQTENVKPRVQ